MKKVLFLSLTSYNIDVPNPNLGKKFGGLSKDIGVFLIGRGKLGHKNIYNSEFYLIPYFSGFWYLPAFFLSLYIILSKGINTIIAQSPLLDGFLGVLLKKITRKELIIELHGDWVEGPFLSKKRKLEFLEKAFIPSLAAATLNNADKIRGVAKYLIEEAKKIAPNKKYFLFPTFTDLDIFLAEKDIASDKFILFVGGLEKVKGVEYLIEAFSKIHNNFKEFRLLIIGKGSEDDFLKSLASRLNIADKVEFKGRLSLVETKDIMKKCYCFVLPSLSEGLPRVIIEAMALGKPVIGSNAGGIPELVNDGVNGFLFKTGNSDSLAEKLATLLSQKGLTEDFGAKGRMLAEKSYSNRKYLENYLEMINN